MLSLKEGARCYIGIVGFVEQKHGIWMDRTDRLYLRFLGSLIEELGAKMYPSVTASVAELISNAWDADASNVWITMPLGTSVKADGTQEIVVIDDGVGMNRDEAKGKYLIVGRKRRSEDGMWQSPSGRPLHGRKGVGKLAAFGTAKLLECTTLTESGTGVAFELEYDRIRTMQAGEDYEVPEVADADPLIRPDTEAALAHGTRIRMSKLLSKRIPAESQFRDSLARRFGVLSPKMRIFLNGKKLGRFEIPIEIRFPRDGVPMLPRDSNTSELRDNVTIEDDWAVESLPQGEVRWWIGFTPKPIKVAELRGIAVLAHEKLVQRPFMFGRSQGTAGQLGQEYLVGEVVANWIDDSITSEDDLVETNRNELQLEDERLYEFLKWGRKRLRWALALRNDIRSQANEKLLFNETVLDRLHGFTNMEQATFKRIGCQLASLPEVEVSAVTELMMDVMDAYDDKSVREMIDRIGEEDESTQERMWGLVAEFGLIDARRTATKIEARIGVINKLQELVEGGATEVPEIHRHLLDNPWLLDPRWDLYGDEVNLTELLREQQGEASGNGDAKADYLFTIGPTTPTSADEVIVVEIKRGTNSDGSQRRVNLDEMNKFSRYVIEAEEYYERGNSPNNRPTVRGLMIANEYTSSAQRQRRAFEQVPGSQYQFKSWLSVLNDTKRLHHGWLQLSSRRGTPRS